MKKALLFLVFLLMFSLSLGMLVGCGGDEPAVEEEPAAEEPADDADIYDFPENKEAMEHILGLVIELGESLEEMEPEPGYYGDLHDAVVADGNRQGPEHLELYEIFNEWQNEVGATYLYSFIDGGDGNMLIIVDGAEPEDMDPYGYEYPYEPWTVAAYETGEPQVAKDAWEDGYGYGLQKSAFYPIRNSDGEIAFLLGIDYPVPELEEFPEIIN